LLFFGKAHWDLRIRKENKKRGNIIDLYNKAWKIALRPKEIITFSVSLFWRQGNEATGADPCLFALLSSKKEARVRICIE